MTAGVQTAAKDKPKPKVDKVAEAVTPPEDSSGKITTKKELITTNAAQQPPPKPVEKPIEKKPDPPKPVQESKPSPVGALGSWVISAIVVGFIVGLLARFFYPGAVPMGFWMTVAIGIGGSLVTRPEILTRALVAGGTEEQKRTWLPRIASGELMAGIVAKL